MSLTLKDVKDYMKTLGLADHAYIARIDASQDKTIGVYDRGAGANVSAVGGCKKYGVKSLTLLYHGTKNAGDTEEKALAIYEAINEIRDVTMGQTHVYYAMPMNEEPIDVGTDENGVWERVIDFDLYYERTVN